jgi:hypothetical protein
MNRNAKGQQQRKCTRTSRVLGWVTPFHGELFQWEHIIRWLLPATDMTYGLGGCETCNGFGATKLSTIWYVERNSSLHNIWDVEWKYCFVFICTGHEKLDWGFGVLVLIYLEAFAWRSLAKRTNWGDGETEKIQKHAVFWRRYWMGKQRLLWGKRSVSLGYGYSVLWLRVFLIEARVFMEGMICKWGDLLALSLLRRIALVQMVGDMPFGHAVIRSRVSVSFRLWPFYHFPITLS